MLVIREIVESGYRGMGGVARMQIYVIYCFIMIQIKGVFDLWVGIQKESDCMHAHNTVREAHSIMPAFAI